MDVYTHLSCDSPTLCKEHRVRYAGRQRITTELRRIVVNAVHADEVGYYRDDEKLCVCGQTDKNVFSKQSILSCWICKISSTLVILLFST